MKPKTLTTTQMREADRRCIEGLGIPGAVLMNNAGAAVFNQINAGPVGIICGKGNNGGDGYVVARLAHLAGYDTQVLLLADPANIKGDAAIFLHAYERLGGRVKIVTSQPDLPAAMESLNHCAVLVDALLGTGINGEVRGIYKAAIQHWPSVKTIAVDIPSGLNADTGEPCGACIKADITVTFQFPKRGFDNPDAAPYVGRLVIADIGIPEICADDEAWHKMNRD